MPKNGLDRVEVRTILMAPCFYGRAVYPRASFDGIIGLPLSAHLGEDQLHMRADPFGNRDCRGATLARGDRAAERGRGRHAAILMITRPHDRLFESPHFVGA